MGWATVFIWCAYNGRILLGGSLIVMLDRIVGSGAAGKEEPKEEECPPHTSMREVLRPMPAQAKRFRLGNLPDLNSDEVNRPRQTKADAEKLHLSETPGAETHAGRCSRGEAFSRPPLVPTGV